MNNKEAIKKLLILVIPYWKTMIFIIGCLLLSTLLTLWIPLMSKNIMDLGFIGRDRMVLIYLAIGILTCRLLNECIEMIKEKKRIEVAANIRFRLTQDFCQHTMKLQINSFNHTNMVELLNKCEVDIDHICKVADGSTFFVITEIFTILGGIVGLFLIEWKLSFLVLLFIPVKFVLIKHFAKVRKETMDSYIEIMGDYAKWFGDMIGGLKEVRLFNMEEQKMREFTERQKDAIGKQKKMDWVGRCNDSMDSIIVSVLITMIYVIGANMIFNLNLTVGSIFAFITYTSFVTTPISAILNIGYFLSGIIPSTKRYYKFMELKEEGRSGNEIPSKGNIEYSHVFFSYDKNVILNGISFCITEEETVALVGINGAGKTTILDLLLRMYDIEKGNIFLNGEDIRKLDIESYRNMFAVVGQQPYLFDDTIRNNIILYKKEIEEKKIMEVIEVCGLGEFVRENTLDYLVGENGSRLSGGQKQKITLARALICDKPILIFDEATSNADVFSNIQFNRLLRTKLKNKTVIIVTHKSDVLKEVDSIIFLEEGNVLDNGTYDELIKRNKSFQQMISLQNK